MKKMFLVLVLLAVLSCTTAPKHRRPPIDINDDPSPIAELQCPGGKIFVGDCQRDVIVKEMLLSAVVYLLGGGPALGGFLVLPDLSGKVGYIGSVKNIIRWRLSMEQFFTSTEQTRQKWMDNDFSWLPLNMVCHFCPLSAFTRLKSSFLGT